MVRKLKAFNYLIVDIILDYFKKTIQPIYCYYKYTRRCSVEEVL